MSSILVIDAEKSLRTLYKRDLEAEGHSVVTAGSAAEAFHAIQRELPDLVVLEIRLAGMDGVDLITKVLRAFPGLPVVLNTVCTSYRDDFPSWGADAFILKSSDTSELRVTIQGLLEARRQRWPIEAQDVA